MAQVTTMKCDECGKLALPGEKWFSMGINDGIIVIVPGYEKRDIILAMMGSIGKPAPATILDICSPDCLGRKMVK